MRASQLAVCAALAAAWVLTIPTPAAGSTLLCESKAVEVEESFLGCAEGEQYGTDKSAGDTISGKLTPDSPHGEGAGVVLFDTPSGDVTCPESTFQAGLGSSGATSAEGEATSLVFGGSCTSTISTCKVTSITTSTPFGASAKYEGVGTAGPNGKLTFKNPKTTVKLSCFAGLFKPTCIYEGGSEEKPLLFESSYYNPENENLPGEEEEEPATGGGVDFADPFALTKSEGSGSELCPKEGTLDATYGLTGNASVTGEVYMAQKTAPTKLCKGAPVEKGPAGEEFLECTKGGFSGTIEGKLLKGQSTTFTATTEPEEPVITCTETAFTGSFKENGTTEGKGVTKLTFTSNGGKKCTSTFIGQPEFAFTVKNLDYDRSSIIYKKVIAPEGEMIFAGTNGKPQLEIEVGKEKCTYHIAGSLVSFSNSAGESQLGLGISWRRDQAKAACPRSFHEMSPLGIKGTKDEVYVARE